MTSLPVARWRRLATVVAGLAAATLALTGCLASSIPDASPSVSVSKAPDTSGVSDDLLPFYGQTLTWESCGAGFDCTTVTAPLDWENPGDDTIELAVTRHSAAEESRGSLLVNPGGPGASGKSFVLDSLTFAVGPDVIEEYDIIGFDPRGVGDSTAVTCFDFEEMDAYLYDIPSAPRGSEAWEAELTAGNAAFAEACEQNSDGILPFITTVNSARDMDLLRAVLGDEKLNYLGYSYGTFLGATYAELFPERVGNLVLDAAVDPSISSMEVGTRQALGFESSLRAYMADCLESKGCPFSGSVDDALGDLGALLASVDTLPLTAGDGRQVGADTMVTGIIAALYSPETWTFLTDGLTSALQGDPTTMLFLADFYNGRGDGYYEDNSTEAFRAYNCMDYPDDEDPAAEEASLALIAKEAPTIAAYWEGPDACSVWPYPPTGERRALEAKGAGPILVIGTTNDPATPYEWAVAMADQLEGGVLITHVGEGHGAYNGDNMCVNDAVESFFLDGDVPEDGLRCE